MFVTFSSDAYENITYFNEVAKRLIRLMGHSGAIPGAIKSGDLANALTGLQQGLAAEKRTTDFSYNANDDDDAEISLAKRAVPLIHLLQASIKKECNVLWDLAKSPD